MDSGNFLDKHRGKGKEYYLTKDSGQMTGDTYSPYKEFINMQKLTIEDLDVKRKRVFLRVDFNVPLDENRLVTVDSLIKAALPTINYLLSNGARLILVSHLGRPKGKASDSLSLRPVAECLEKTLEKKIVFSPTVIGTVAQTAIDCLNPGHCLLMENIRFFPEEEKNDSQFSKDLASLVDLYVNDAFGTAHRAHASTEGIAKYFDNAACGYLIKKELEFLGKLASKPEQPYCAVIGGAKVKDKIGVITNLLDRVENVLIGGGMAYTFLKVLGKNIGQSILDQEHLDIVESMFEKAEKLNKKIHLPVDHVVSEKFDNECPVSIVEDNIPDEMMGLDIGPKTVENYLKALSSAKTVFWNGPMGVFEMSNFQKGTFEIAKGLSESNAVTVVGGGDSVAAVNKANLGHLMSHISTGGGASLKFLEGKPLPGLEALADKG